MQLPRTIFTVQLEPATLSLINAFARNHGASAAPFASAEELLRTSMTGRAGCVVLGLTPQGDGDWLRPLTVLQKAGVLLPTIVLLDQPSVALAVSAMRQGALSVLEAPPDPAALEQALQDALAEDLRTRIARQQREDIITRLSTLTEGERDVLHRLLAGMANKNIAADLQLGLRTVELRRAKILQKLGARSLAEMVRLVTLADAISLESP
jgi:FixJ family two-component response regulator